jgi:hypothetical protein
MFGAIEVVANGENIASHQDIKNVLHFRSDNGVPTNAQVDACITFVQGAYALLFPTCNTNYRLNSVTGRNIAVENGYEKTVYLTAPNTGTRGGNASPADNTVAMSWRTAQSGRRNRGRSYLGLYTAADINGDTITNVVVNWLTQFATYMIANGPAPGVKFGIRSLRDVGIKIVTGFVLDTVIDAQRRRLTDRGR